MKTRLAFLPAVLALLIPALAHAQWIPSGVPVCNAANDQTWVRAGSDGAGGVIAVWTDPRGTDQNIYAQRIDANGTVMWPTDGVPVCAAAGDQTLPSLIPDGAGGAIIVWEDSRAGTGVWHIYAQRVNSMGASLWTANGVVVCTAANLQVEPVIVSDGAGGAIMAWRDSRNDPITSDIYAQRVNSAGVAQWAANGKSVCLAANHQTMTQITTDGANGAIITWADLRNGNDFDIYTQRMSSAGAPQWTSGGVAIGTGANNQIYESIVTDGAGGAVIAWHDERSGNGSDIYAQRVNASGATQWTVGGVAISLAAVSQDNPVMVPDGSGGAFIAWDDLRRGDAHYDVYARRVSGSGVPLWKTDGIPICTADGDQFRQVITSDNAGGVVIAWLDNRGGSNGYYAQRVTRNGDILWTPDGVRAWPAQGYGSLLAIASDAGGNVIIVGPEYRSEGSDIFAQRIDVTLGWPGHPEPTVTSVADVRSDQGGKVNVNWKASGVDAIPQTNVTHYSVWRATDVASLTSLIDSPSAVTKDFKGRATWLQKSAATSYYWELVGTEDATRQAGYSFAAETRADSVAGNAATHHFMVIAHTDDPFKFWSSNEMSGRSVDNLAPLAPLALSAQRAGSYVYLKWKRVRVSDLHNYTVYRTSSSGVTPIPINFLANATDTVLTDSSAPASALYYIVTATDVHANQGAASNEAAVAAATGVSNLPPITSLMVMQNRPNPFGTSSSFDLGLPASSHVSVEVFDVGGRRVASHALGARPAGWQSVTLDALDDAGRPLASGVYFYRIHAAGQTLTRKMVIAR